MLISDPKQAGIDTLLHRVYEIYSDFALKNPFYSLEMPIRCELFDEHIKSTLEQAERLGISSIWVVWYVSVEESSLYITTWFMVFIFMTVIIVYERELVDMPFSRRCGLLCIKWIFWYWMIYQGRYASCL